MESCFTDILYQPYTGFKSRRSRVSLNRIKRCEESANGSACIPCGDKQNVVLALEM
jgi:hypothetical protein